MHDRKNKYLNSHVDSSFLVMQFYVSSYWRKKRQYVYTYKETFIFMMVQVAIYLIHILLDT